jgi:hypothetical protein
MTVTASTIDAAVTRWIAEANRLTPRAANTLLSQKVRRLRRAAELGNLPGSAVDISDAISRLLVAAASSKDRPGYA